MSNDNGAKAFSQHVIRVFARCKSVGKMTNDAIAIGTFKKDIPNFLIQPFKFTR